MIEIKKMFINHPSKVNIEKATRQAFQKACKKGLVPLPSLFPSIEIINKNNRILIKISYKSNYFCSKTASERQLFEFIKWQVDILQLKSDILPFLKLNRLHIERNNEIIVKIELSYRTEWLCQ